MENQSSSSLIEANPKKDPVLIYEYDVKQESPLRVAFRRVVEKVSKLFSLKINAVIFLVIWCTYHLSINYIYINFITLS